MLLHVCCSVVTLIALQLEFVVPGLRHFGVRIFLNALLFMQNGFDTT